MNYDEMLKTTQKKAQVINTKSDEQKKLKLANPDEKNKLKPQKAADKEFISKQTAAQNEFKKKYMSRRTGFDIIDGPEIEESSFVPVQESVELRAFDKTFKNRIKKDAKQWVSKWNDICQINDLNKNGYGFKIASKNVNYKTYSMMVGLNNWANAQKLKEQCASVLKGNKFYQKNKKIIDALAPSPKMDIKAVKESENSSNNPLVLDPEYKKFTAGSVEAVRKYYEQFNTKDENVQAELLKTVAEESLISMDYINDKALSPDAMPQKIMESKLLRDRLEAIHLYSATNGNTINEEFSEHIKLARQLFMALDADMRTCFVKNGMDFAENGSFLLEMNKQGVQINSTYKSLSTAYHNLAKNHKEKGHCAELIIKSLAGYDTKKKNKESSNFVDIFNKELEEKIEAHGTSGDDDLGIGQAVVNMQSTHEDKYQSNKTMLDPMIEDAKKVATSIDSLKHQIEYMEKIASGTGVPDDSIALSIRVQRNESLKKALNADIEQKKRQVVDLLGRANGYLNAMSNIYTDSELSPEGQDIIEKYRLDPDTYTDNSQTAKLLRKIGEISGPSKFKNTPELKADLIEKLCAAKAKSLNKDNVTNKQKEQIRDWINSPSGSLCLADLELKGVDVTKLSNEALYKKMREYGPLLGELAEKKKSGRKNKLLEKLVDKEKYKDEKVLKSITDQISEISIEFQKLFAENFGSIGDLEAETATAVAFRAKIEKLIELRNKYDSVQKVLYSEIDDKDNLTQLPVKKTLIQSIKDKMSLERKASFEKLHAMYQKEFKVAENTLLEFKLGEIVKKLDMGVSVKKIVEDKVFGDQPDLYNIILAFSGAKEDATEEDLITCIKTFYAKHKDYTSKTLNDLLKQFEDTNVPDQKSLYDKNINFFVKKLRDYSAGKYEEKEENNLLQEAKMEIVKELEEKRNKALLDEQKKLQDKAFGGMFNKSHVDMDDEYYDTTDEELEKEVDYLLSIGNNNVDNSLEFSLSEIAKGNDQINKLDKKLLYMDEKYLTQEEKTARENYMLLLNNIVSGAKLLNIDSMNENGKDAVQNPLLRKEARKLARIKNFKQREKAKAELKEKLLSGDKDLDGLSAGTKLRILLMCDSNISGKTAKYEIKKQFSINTDGTQKYGNRVTVNYQYFDKDEIREILRNFEKLSFSPMLTWRDEADAMAEQEAREANIRYKEMVTVPKYLQKEVDRLLGIANPITVGKDVIYGNTILSNVKTSIESHMKRFSFDKRILYLDEDLLTPEEKTKKKAYLTDIYKYNKAFDEIYGEKSKQEKYRAKQDKFIVLGGDTFADIKSDYDHAVILDMAKKLAKKNNSEDELDELKQQLEDMTSSESKLNDSTRFRLKLLYYNKFGIDNNIDERNNLSINNDTGIYNLLNENARHLGTEFVDNTDYKYRSFYTQIRKNRLKFNELKNNGELPVSVQRKIDADAISNVIFFRDLSSVRELIDLGDDLLSEMGKAERRFIDDFFKGVKRYLGDKKLPDTSISDEEVKELKYIVDSTGYDMVELKAQMDLLNKNLKSKYVKYSEGFKIRLAGIISSYTAMANNSDEMKEHLVKKESEGKKKAEGVKKQKNKGWIEDIDNEKLDGDAVGLFEDEDVKWNDYVAKIKNEEDLAAAKIKEQEKAEKAVQAQVEEFKNAYMQGVIDQYKKFAAHTEKKNKRRIELAKQKNELQKTKKSQIVVDLLESRYKMRSGLKQILFAEDLKSMYRAFDARILFIQTPYLKNYEKTLTSMFFKIKERMISYKKTFDDNGQDMDMSMSEKERMLLSDIMDSFALTGKNFDKNIQLKNHLLNELNKKDDGEFLFCSDGFKLRLTMLLYSGYDDPSKVDVGFSNDEKKNIEKYYADIDKLGFDEFEQNLFEAEKYLNSQNADKYSKDRLNENNVDNEFNALEKEVNENINASAQENVQENAEASVEESVEESADIVVENAQEQLEKVIDNKLEGSDLSEEQKSVIKEEVKEKIKEEVKEEVVKALKKGISLDEYDADIFEKPELDEEVLEELNALKKAKDTLDSVTKRMTLDDADIDVELAVNSVIKPKMSELGSQKDDSNSDTEQKVNEKNAEETEKLFEKISEDFVNEIWTEELKKVNKEDVNKIVNEVLKEEIKKEEKKEEKRDEKEDYGDEESELNKVEISDLKDDEEHKRMKKEEEERKKKEEERLRKKKEEEERLRKEKEEEELRLKKEKEEEERLRIAQEKYELAKKKYLDSLKAQKASRRKEIKKILESMLNNELDKMEENMEGKTEEEMQKVIDNLTDEKFKYGIKKGNYNFGDISSSMFKIFVTNEYGKFEFVKNEIDDKDEEIDRKVLLRFALHTLGKNALKHEYWQYVENLPETDYRNIFYKKLLEALPENSYNLDNVQMLYFDKLFEHIDDYSSPRQLRDRMYELEKDFPQFYEEGKLKRGAFEYYYDLMKAWEKAESAALDSEPIQKQKYDKLYKELHDHEKMEIKLTEDVYKDKYQKKCYINNGDTFEPQFYKNSCYATCSAYLLNKFFIQNPNLIDSTRLDKYRSKNSKFGKDEKGVYVNQEDFKYGKLRINDIAQEALDNKGPFDADTNLGIQYAYKNFLEESNSENDSERDIYSISDKFINMSENVCVNCIEFEPFSDFYTKALKKETEKDKLPFSNSALDSSIDKYKVDRKKRKHFTPYMRDIKENYFQTVVGKIEELMEERPNTPIALLTADYGQAGHYVVVKGTTTDGRLIVMNPMHKKDNEGDTSELIPDMLMDVDKFFGYSGDKPGFTLTWLEKFDSKKAQEVEKKCDMKGASYNEKGELVNSTAAEKSNLSDKASWLAHRNGVSFEVNKKLKGKNGDLFNHHIYVPKTYDPTVK